MDAGKNVGGGKAAAGDEVSGGPNNKGPGKTPGANAVYPFFTLDSERLATLQPTASAYHSTNPGEPGGACRMASKIGLL
ncbi:hypothetical protein JCM14719A_07900 [Calditerricola satsumensis]|uniref:Uncharacterized protein n=1 Tax=Calditerricola satsumensis TaxID=373054 RepID=A0A8J3BCP9_9BACI|nr:hypothetical protein GCM10007043_10380 [Calditerricola satsumensis]